jgi:hypothetical protein
MDRAFVLDFKRVEMRGFILFWKDYYNEGKYPDDEYEYHLRKDGVIAPEGLLYLLEWKNGNPLSGKKMQIYRVAVENLDRLMGFRLRGSIGGEDVVELLRLVSGIIRTGLIWKIFLMHITRPEDFPMFDQHVYRAYCFLENGEITETSFTESDFGLYHQYRSFVIDLSEKEKIDLRTIDKALFAFGRFIKEYKAQFEENS